MSISGQGIIVRAAGIVVISAVLSCAHSTASAADNSKHIKNMNSKDARTRVRSITELSKSKAESAGPDLLSKLKTEKEADVRISLVNSLANINVKEAEPELSRLALEDASPDVRGAACLALGSLQDNGSIPLLQKILENEAEDITVRNNAAGALVLYNKSIKAYSALEKQLSGGREEIRFSIVNTLRSSTDKKEGRRLLEVARKDKSEAVRVLAEELLSKK